MRRILGALYLLIFLIISAGCVHSIDMPQNNVINRKISADEAKEMLDANESALLLDVRSTSEYEEIRIPGSFLLPDFEIVDKASEMLPDKDALILVYCRSGRRSAESARVLIEMGYANVYDFGGILDWPFETEGE